MSENRTKKVSAAQIGDREFENHHVHDDKEFVTNTGPKFGSRHVQMILLVLALVLGMATKTNLSVAIVAMTDNTTSPNPNVPTYNWTDTSVILSSFFWTYISLQIPAGYLGRTYGPKYFLLVALFVNFCACAVTPLAAEQLGSTGVMLCRLIQGLGQGFLYPSVHVMLGRWVPEQERTTLSSFTFTGIPLGIITGSLISGYVSSSWWGWPTSFYILSGMGFCWCIIWLGFGQNSPASHPRITNEERNYIQSSLKQTDNLDLPTPWKQIFTCVPFYALMISFAGGVWGHSIMLTESPTYLSKVMNFNLNSSAIISSMPTVIGLVCGLITGPMSDWIISRKLLTALNARRIFNMIGLYGQALCFTWLSCLNSSQAVWCIVSIGLNNASQSFILIGCNVNHLDLSPRFAGVLFGIMNAVAQVGSTLGPLSANWIVTDQTDVSQWRIVFLIAAGFNILGATIFFFFASATRQSWDGPESPKLYERKKKVSVFSLMSI